MITRKDFTELAEYISTHKRTEESLEDTIDYEGICCIMDFLKDNNPSFDRERFLEVCNK